jgi:glycosyltransferase involved in cell wall biosynthesis
MIQEETSVWAGSSSVVYKNPTVSSPPEISILMSAYNSADTINKSLQSIQSQSFKDWEVIIVDDASTDETHDILLKWQQELGQEKFTIIKNDKNIGLTKSLNKCLRRAGGKFIARLDADDYWHSEKLTVQSAYLSRYPAVGVVGSNYVNLLQEKAMVTNLPKHDRDIRNKIYRLNPFGHSCVLMRKQLLLSIDGYDPSVYYGQDRDLWFRLMPLTTFHNIQDTLCYRRIDEGISVSSSSRQMWQSIKTKIHYIGINRAPLVNYLHLALPLLILLTPKKVKRFRNNKRFSRNLYVDEKGELSIQNLNLLFINDRPMIKTRAETVARNAMYKALSKHPSMQSSRVIDTSPARALFCQIPSSADLLYLRSGALTAASIAIRNLFNRRIIILEVHNFMFGNNRLADVIYRLSAKRCQLLVTITKNTKKNWSTHGIPNSKILVQPSGFDKISFTSIASSSKKSLRQKLGLPVKKKIITYSGNLYRHRGIEDMLQAADKLSSDPLVLFVILGGTESDLDYYKEHMRKNYPSLNNVLWLGHKPIDKVASYLVAADAVLVTYSKQCPTVSTMSPIKLFEALASGTPTVAANLPAIRHIADSKHVTYYQADDGDSLADKISEVLRSPNDYLQRAKLAQSVSFPYNWSSRAQRIIQNITR